MAASPEKYLKFIRCLTTTTGKWAGKPFDIRDFQEEWIRGIFQRQWDPEERRWARVVREAVIGVARKCGKSELIAAIALASLVIEGERGGLVICAAAKREQAALILTAAKRMVLQSKIKGTPLSNYLKVRRDSIYFPELDATFKTIAADAQKEHGLNPHLVIVDEGHATMEKDRELYDTLLTAQGAREDPLAIVITTAGPAPKGPMYDLYRYGKEVESGERVDPSFWFKWYEAPEGCEIDDPAAWKAAAPALGHFLPEKFYQQTARAVLSGRMPEFQFRRLHLNQWTSAYERWLPHEKVTMSERAEPEFPEGCEVVIGVDAAIKRDRFAVVMTRVDADGILHVKSKAFVPEREGAYIDHEDIQTYILGLAQRFNITKVVYDPAYMSMLAGSLEERGVPMEPYPQSATKMEIATEALQRVFLDENILIGTNKDMYDHLAACAIKPTERGVRLSKLKALMPTDLAIALSMCCAVHFGEADLSANLPALLI